MSGRTGLAALLTLGAVGLGVIVMFFVGQVSEEGPLWLRSLVNAPYLALAGIGIDAGFPGFWVAPLIVSIAGCAWAVGMTRLAGAGVGRWTPLAAIAFAISVLAKDDDASWWLPWLIGEPGDAVSPAFLLIGIAESTFVVGATSAGALALTLGRRWRAAAAALVSGSAAVAGVVLVYVALDALGIRVGTGDAAMVKVSLPSVAAGALSGGAALAVVLRR